MIISRTLFDLWYFASIQNVGCGAMTWLKDEQKHLTWFEYYSKLT
jgi:hypothetical protein